MDDSADRILAGPDHNFDGGVAARSGHCGKWRRDIERNVMLLCQDRNTVRSNFIRDIAVCRNSVGPHNDGIDQPLVHECPGHIV